MFSKVTNFIYLIFLSISLFIASDAQANAAACILLKQQMSSFSHAKSHPNYRYAKREYDKKCKQQATTPSPQTELSKTVEELPAEVAPEAKITDAQKEAARKEFERLEKLEQEKLAKEQEAKRLEIEKAQREALEKRIAEQELAKQKAEQEARAEKARRAAQLAAKPVQQQRTDTPFNSLLLPISVLLLVLAGGLVAFRIVKQRENTLPNVNNGVFNKSSSTPVKRNKHDLDPDVYHSFKRIELDTGNKTKVMIERAIVSQYGVFAILTQKQRGAIIGTAMAAEWKEQSGEEVEVFLNPIHQNNQACAALGRLLEIDSDVESVILFNDMAHFKSQFPIIVMHRKALSDYITGFKELKYSDEEVDNFIEILNKKLNIKSVSSANEPLVSSTPHPNKDKPAPSASVTRYPAPGSYVESVSEIEEDATDASNSFLNEPVEDETTFYDAIMANDNKEDEQSDVTTTETQADTEQAIQQANEVVEKIEALEKSFDTLTKDQEVLTISQPEQGVAASDSVKRNDELQSNELAEDDNTGLAKDDSFNTLKSGNQFESPEEALPQGILFSQPLDETPTSAKGDSSVERDLTSDNEHNQLVQGERSEIEAENSTEEPLLSEQEATDFDAMMMAQNTTPSDDAEMQTQEPDSTEEPLLSEQEAADFDAMMMAQNTTLSDNGETQTAVPDSTEEQLLSEQEAADFDAMMMAKNTTPSDDTEMQTAVPDSTEEPLLSEQEAADFNAMMMAQNTTPSDDAEMQTQEPDSTEEPLLSEQEAAEFDAMMMAQNTTPSDDAETKTQEPDSIEEPLLSEQEATEFDAMMNAQSPRAPETEQLPPLASEAAKQESATLDFNTDVSDEDQALLDALNSLQNEVDENQVASASEPVKTKDDKSSNPFANLSLDPDWDPKEAPKPIYKSPDEDA